MNLAFKALADPTRREILQLLRSGGMTAGDIAEQFAMTKPSISHHLKLLKQANLISDEKQGQFIVYTLNTSVVEDALTWIFDLTKQNAKE
ncbi:MAG: autorepressor SdpR family transcription factor [Culicoidibacterales bacterium]